MTKREFIRQHRDEITAAVEKAYGQNAAPINDSEREDWVMNDEGLYDWARSEGVQL